MISFKCRCHLLKICCGWNQPIKAAQNKISGWIQTPTHGMIWSAFRLTGDLTFPHSMEYVYVFVWTHACIEKFASLNYDPVDVSLPSIFKGNGTLSKCQVKPEKMIPATWPSLLEKKRNVWMSLWMKWFAPLINAYPLEAPCDHFSRSSQLSQLCGCISSRDLNPEGWDPMLLV